MKLSCGSSKCDILTPKFIKRAYWCLGFFIFLMLFKGELTISPLCSCRTVSVVQQVCSANSKASRDILEYRKCSVQSKLNVSCEKRRTESSRAARYFQSLKFKEKGEFFDELL